MLKLIRRGWSNSIPGRAALVSCLVGGLAWGTIAGAQQKIVIKIDGKVVEHRTLQRTLGGALAEAGVEVGPRDAVSPDLATPVKRGMQVTVNRAVPVRVFADGQTRVVLTPPTPVGRVLALASIKLGPQDRVSLPLTATVTKNTVVRVTRVSEKIFRENYSLPFAEERRPDPQMERGRLRLVRAGEAGEGERTIKVTYEDGREIKRTVLEERVLRPPRNRIIAYGTGGTVAGGGSVIRFQRVLEAHATAYSPSAGKYTATGYPVQYGVVAVDPSIIPLGTRLYVEGYGFARALDVGGAIKGNRIDLFFESEADCRKWGHRRVKVYILE
jgi:uncharacterized protein YabE (DUF348 family)